MVLHDFVTNLMHQTTCLKEFEIVYECHTEAPEVRENWVVEERGKMLSARIGDFLKNRSTTLKTEEFWMGALTQDEIMQVLPYIDKDSLKTIKILYPTEQNYFRPNNRFFAWELLFDVDKISATEQWRSVTHLLIETCTVTTPIPNMNITYFSHLDILVKTISPDDVFYLKTELLRSAVLGKYRITFRESTIDGCLQSLIGEPYRITAAKNIWFFRMTDPDYYLHIVLETLNLLYPDGTPKLKSIFFAKVDKEDTPFFR